MCGQLSKSKSKSLGFVPPEGLVPEEGLVSEEGLVPEEGLDPKEVLDWLPLQRNLQPRHLSLRG